MNRYPYDESCNECAAYFTLTAPGEAYYWNNGDRMEYAIVDRDGNRHPIAPSEVAYFESFGYRIQKRVVSPWEDA